MIQSLTEPYSTAVNIFQLFSQMLLSKMASQAWGAGPSPSALCDYADGWQAITSYTTTLDYQALIDHAAKPTQRSAMCEWIGINSAAWPALLNTGGLFPGITAGYRAARDRFGRSQGKRTLADKTKTWVSRYGIFFLLVRECR